MDENNNGPVPGIIGQDTPSEESTTTTSEPKDSGKIFDSSEFTGVSNENESLVLNNGDQSEKQAKAKDSNLFTKWQLWAILCGIILAGSAAAILVIISIYDGKIKNTENVARYDAAVKNIESAKSDFDANFTKLVDTSYGVSGYHTSYAIYPDDSEIEESKKSCLGRYDVKSDDVEFINSLKTGQELFDAGENVTEAKERVERIVAGYNSANSALDTCKEDVLKPFLDDLEITFGDTGTVPYEGRLTGSYVYLTRPMTIKNKSKKNRITSLTLTYELKNRDGVVMKTRTVYLSNVQLWDGAEVTADLYDSGYSKYYTSAEDSEKELAYKPELKSISGNMQYETNTSK